MAKIELRYQRISDAKIFYRILSNPNFIYFGQCPTSVEDELSFLKKNKGKRKLNLEHNFSILYNGSLVGGCGVKIDCHRNFSGEIGYFLDEAFWGKGITSIAVKLLEKICFEKLKLKRITILMDPRNIPSEKVAIKCGYYKEGTMKNVLHGKQGYHDAHLYAKVR